MLSVVIPAYNEQETVAAAAEEISRVLEAAGISHELVFIDDGSKDRTWECIRTEARRRPAVRGFRFSRNFGKEAAIFAGLGQAKGDCVAVMDCDLQHPPEKLVEMYRLWEDGAEVIEGVKTDRGQESALHRGIGLQAARPQGGERASDHAGKARLLPCAVVLGGLPHGAGAL